MGLFSKVHCTGCGESYSTGAYNKHLEWCSGPSTVSQVDHDHVDSEEVYIDWSRLGTTTAVKQYVKQLRAARWSDNEIRRGFEGSRIDIDRYL